MRIQLHPRHRPFYPHQPSIARFHRSSKTLPTQHSYGPAKGRSFGILRRHPTRIYFYPYLQLRDAVHLEKNAPKILHPWRERVSAKSTLWPINSKFGAFRFDVRGGWSKSSYKSEKFNQKSNFYNDSHVLFHVCNNNVCRSPIARVFTHIPNNQLVSDSNSIFKQVLSLYWCQAIVFDQNENQKWFKKWILKQTKNACLTIQILAVYEYTIICLISIARYCSARNQESKSLHKKSYSSEFRNNPTSPPTRLLSWSIEYRSASPNFSEQCFASSFTASRKSCRAWLNSFRLPVLGLKYLHRRPSSPLQFEGGSRGTVDHLTEASERVNHDVSVIAAVERVHGIHSMGQVSQHAVESHPVHLHNRKSSLVPGCRSSRCACRSPWCSSRQTIRWRGRSARCIASGSPAVVCGPPPSPSPCCTSSHTCPNPGRFQKRRSSSNRGASPARSALRPARVCDVLRWRAKSGGTEYSPEGSLSHVATRWKQDGTLTSSTDLEVNSSCWGSSSSWVLNSFSSFRESILCWIVIAPIRRSSTYPTRLSLLRPLQSGY